MFQGCEFTFAGVSSSEFGLYIVDFDSKKNDDTVLSSGKISETRLPNRVTPLHYGVNYNDEPLSFTLIFGSDNELDRYDMQRISMWLTGYQQYQWLMVDQPDLGHVQYRCLITELEPISYGWVNCAFQAKISCDCQYAYSFPWEASYTLGATETTATFMNESSCKDKLSPDFEITVAAGCTAVTVKNDTTGQTMKFENMPSGSYKLVIDGKNLIIKDANNNMTNPYSYFNFVFLKLAPGVNTIKLSKTGSGAATVKMSGRFLYSVGA